VTHTLAQPLSDRLPGAYWRQWTASAISNLVDDINAAALPLLALTLTDDPRLIAGVTFFAFIPWLLLSLPAGVIVDRYNRQMLMVSTNAIRAALMIGLAVTAGTGALTIWLLYTLLLGIGICEVLFDNAAQAFLPAIVEPAQLPRANGRLYAAETVANNFLGQPFGAVLFAFAIGVPFGLDAISFAVAAVFVATIRVQPGALPPSRRGQPTHFRAEIRESLRWLFERRLLRTLALMLGVVNMASTFGVAIFVAFATETLHVSTRWYGALLALMALGAVLGGLIGDRVVRRLGQSLALRASYVVFGLATIGMGLSPTYWVVAAFSFVDALAGTVWNITTVSLRQQIIPTNLFGRVNSVYRWIGTGSTAIGALVGGQLAFRFDLRTPFVVGGCVILLVFLIGARGLSQHEITRATDAH
jgi:MFS family permease